MPTQTLRPRRPRLPGRRPRRLARVRSSAGLILLDVLFGMVLFALLAATAVQEYGNQRVRGYETGTASDARQIGTTVQAALASDPDLPADKAAFAALLADPDNPLGVNLTDGNTLGGYETLPDGGFRACVVRLRGGTPVAWSVFDSDTGLVAKGRVPAAVPALCEQPDAPPPPPPPPPYPVFVEAVGGVKNEADASLDIPLSVQEGDLLLLAQSAQGSSAAPNLTTPAGWTRPSGHPTQGRNSSVLYWKVATSADAGATVSLPATGWTRRIRAIAVYRGAGTPTFTYLVDGSSSDTARPVVDTTADDSAVVNVFATTPGSCCSTASTWTPPPGTVTRHVAHGYNYTNQLIVEEIQVAAGTIAARSAVWNGSSHSAIAWTVVVPPD